MGWGLQNLIHRSELGSELSCRICMQSFIAGITLSLASAQAKKHWKTTAVVEFNPNRALSASPPKASRTFPFLPHNLGQVLANCERGCEIATQLLPQKTIGFMYVAVSSVNVHVIAPDALSLNLLILLTTGWVLYGDS